MGRSTTILLLLLLQGFPLKAQVAIPTLVPTDVDGASLTTRGTFVGKGLYGYIDGGADLYFEYGFRSLIVQSVAIANESYEVEVYVMSDSVAAAGIFSVSRFGCTPDRELSAFSCVSQHQVQFARGPYFVRIANTSGSSQADLQGRQLANRLIARIHEGPFTPPPLFADSLLGNGNLRSLLICRGTLGLQNGIDDWVDLFEGIERFELEVLPIEQDTSAVRVAVLQVQAESDRETFLRRWNAVPDPGLHRSSVLRGWKTAMLLESRASERDLTPFLRLLERY